MSVFDLLPSEDIIEIGMRLPIEDINIYCQLSTRFNEVICNSEAFWRDRFYQDIGEPKINITSWKHAYQNYGTVVGFGLNTHGQLGLGKVPNALSPVIIPKIRAKSVSCGFNHTMIIDFDNYVWCFGENSHGQLGLGDREFRRIPTPFIIQEADERPFTIRAKAIAFGSMHTVMIDLNSDVWSFGYNGYGQLGLGNKQSQDAPLPIFVGNNKIKAKAVSCNQHYTMLIDLEDNVWAFGSNTAGELGLGDTVNRSVPTQIPNIKAKSVSCGSGHTLIIDLNNNIWAYGWNKNGQLGLGDTVNRNIPTLLPNIQAKSISCGGWHTMIIDLNDNVWAFGGNNHGQLGLINYEDTSEPTLINMQAKSISCGTAHTIIIDSNNIAWSFGWNNHGQLGLGSEEDEDIPTLVFENKAISSSCGHSHTIILTL